MSNEQYNLNDETQIHEHRLWLW